MKSVTANEKKQPATSDRTKLRCPVCGNRLETTTTIRDGSGTARIISSRPDELTECEKCESMLEYSGRPGELRVMTARPERASAFRELARDEADHASFQKMVAYVVKYRMRPHASGMARFHFSCRELSA
jgi:transcription initiation factor IIE alpha subunit